MSSPRHVWTIVAVSSDGFFYPARSTLLVILTDHQCGRSYITARFRWQDDEVDHYFDFFKVVPAFGVYNFSFFPCRVFVEGLENRALTILSPIALVFFDKSLESRALTRSSLVILVLALSGY